MFATIRMCLLPLAAVLLVGGAESAQDKKDPQSSIEPRSKPGAGQKFLEKFVGDWDVAKTFHSRNGEPSKTKGECRQSMTHGGRFLVSEFSFGEGDAKTTGTGTIGFEADTGLFTSTWIDSRATRMSFRQGQEKFNGEEIVLHGKSLDESKPGRKSRTVTKLEDEGRRIVHRQYGDGADGKERLVMELVMTKKAPSGK